MCLGHRARRRAAFAKIAAVGGGETAERAAGATGAAGAEFADIADQLTYEGRLAARRGGGAAGHGQLHAIGGLFRVDSGEYAVLVEGDDRDRLLFDAGGAGDARAGLLAQIQPGVLIEAGNVGRAAQFGLHVGLGGNPRHQLGDVARVSSLAAIDRLRMEQAAAGKPQRERQQRESAGKSRLVTQLGTQFGNFLTRDRADCF